MASSLEFIQYICNQMRFAAPVTYRAMFEEYGLYAEGKFFASICDDQLFLKPTGAVFSAGAARLSRRQALYFGGKSGGCGLCFPPGPAYAGCFAPFPAAAQKIVFLQKRTAKAVLLITKQISFFSQFVFNLVQRFLVFRLHQVPMHPVFNQFFQRPCLSFFHFFYKFFHLPARMHGQIHRNLSVYFVLHHHRTNPAAVVHNGIQLMFYLLVCMLHPIYALACCLALV